MLTLSDRTAVAAAAILAAAAYLLLTPLGHAASVSVHQTGGGNVSVHSTETNGQGNVSVRVNGQEVNWNTSDAGVKTDGADSTTNGVRTWQTPTSTVQIWQEPTTTQWNDDAYRATLFRDTYCTSLPTVRQSACLRGMQRAEVLASLDAYRAWYQHWVQNLRTQIGGYSNQGWGTPTLQMQQSIHTTPWSWRMRNPDWRSQGWSEVYWF